jgi:hypothetical protein
MDERDIVNDVRFLRDVVAKTQPPDVNYFWPVTLMWGCVVSVGYLACALLGIAGRTGVIRWVMPVLVFLVGWPLHWYLGRKVRSGLEDRGVRPRFRKDLRWCWMSIYGMGMLWTAGLIISGVIARQGPLLVLVWCTLLVVGYVMNGALLSKEWFWAAGALLASLIAAFLIGFLRNQPVFYWLPGYWIPGTFLLAGLLGRRNAQRQTVNA